jgi:mono/diheme cytochrome c family protein
VVAGALVALASAWLVGRGVAQTPARALPGQAVYEEHCAVCHGSGGQADGPGAAALPVKPPAFAEARLMQGLPDDFLFRVISEGSGAVGLAPQMPAFGRRLTERQIWDVVGYVRSMADPAVRKALEAGRPYAPRRDPPLAVRAPAPAQPIEFSHVIHAGSYGIECLYCHADARRSAYAGLPSVERCMGCHKIVAAQGNPEVQKLQQFWTRKEPVPWVRIHKVPGFVYFPHKRHVQAGLACQTCHGPVERMQRVAQVAPLTMGWCVDCHHQRQAPLDCVNCHH